MGKHDTPMLDELENGPWPSFVSDIKQQAEKGKHHLKDAPSDLMGVLELSFKDRVGHWKHGGIVGVFGYGGGIIGRYCDQPQMFPGVAQFHTLRVNQPASKYYTTEYLRTLCDIWEKHGSGLTNMHGSTGDIILLGTVTEQLEPLFYDLTHELKQDLGGSGSNLRTPECCLGESRCEFACYDSQECCFQLTREYQNELHRPAFPYKFKIKFDACPNGCVASIARADMSVIGTWRDDIRIDQAAVAAYVGGELLPNAGAHADRAWGKFSIQEEVIDLCPSQCMRWDGRKIEINNPECVRCMHCLNVMPRALRIGLDRGASVLFGAKAPILEGAQMSTLTVPFMKMEPPFGELKELLEKVWDWWMEEGKNRERLGELIQRKSFREFLRALDLDPNPRMVDEPRCNPYIFWKEEEVEGGWTRDIEAYRAKHLR